MFALSVYATQALHGVVSGMLLFLVASGLTLVFGMMGILNIAHAGFYMLGAYLAYSTVHATGHFWLSLLVAPLVVGALGALVERFLLRRTHAFGHAYELLLTFGLFFMIGEAVRWIWQARGQPGHREAHQGLGGQQAQDRVGRRGRDAGL